MYFFQVGSHQFDKQNIFQMAWNIWTNRPTKDQTGAPKRLSTVKSAPELRTRNSKRSKVPLMTNGVLQAFWSKILVGFLGPNDPKKL